MKLHRSASAVEPTWSRGCRSYYGVALYSSPATAAGTVWLVSGPGVTVYRREQVTVEVGWNATDWSTNTKTARAEERVGIAVTRPNSLYKLVLT